MEALGQRKSVCGNTVSGAGSMTSDDRIFALVQRLSAIESQLITRRAFLVGTDEVDGLWVGEDRPDAPAKPEQ